MRVSEGDKMTNRTVITAASNPKIKHVKALLSKGKVRRSELCFAAEGVHLFEEAPDALLREIYVAESFFKTSEEAVLKKNKPVYIVEDRLFEQISDTQSPQGILCVVQIPYADPMQLIGTDQPLFLLLDEIRDPGNLGTMIRTGEAAGVSGIWLTDGCADPYQPKVVRSAMGALYRVPVISLNQTEEDLQQMAQIWKDKGIRLYGTLLGAVQVYDKPDYRTGTAFVIGNESRGVSPEVLALCDEQIRIPMRGQVESLNAAIAASLLMFEAARQRRM